MCTTEYTESAVVSHGTSHVTLTAKQCCKFITSMDIKMHYKKLVPDSLIYSHMQQKLSESTQEWRLELYIYI